MIERSFFQRDPVVCAREMIGVELVWGRCAGIIVETEAYSTVGDAACHTFLRPSAREFVARHPAGTAYIYLNYGMHWLLNILVKSASAEGFVLIRALQPVRGIGAMKRRRGTSVERALCSGPGKLTQALGIPGSNHGCDLCTKRGPHFTLPAQRPEIIVGSRIGISRAADLPWRFLVAGSPFVSVPARKKPGS